MTEEGTLAKEQETQEEDGVRNAKVEPMTQLRVGASANFAGNLKKKLKEQLKLNLLKLLIQ